MPVTIRPASVDDADALYAICLQTGHQGQDATSLYQDPRLIGHIYAAPYLSVGPSLSFVVEDELGVAGYVVGATDTRAFERNLERDWWPDLRPRYADPGSPPFATEDAKRCAMIHHPVSSPQQVVKHFPAHMHGNVLPRLQGQGWGTHLVAKWLDAAASSGASGVHVGVSPLNTGGAKFWQKCGFEPIEMHDEHEVRPALWFGQTLKDRSV